MTIVAGTPVRLPDGREGVIVPPPIFSRNRVLVKVKGGRKRWFSVSECVPVSPTPQ